MKPIVLYRKSELEQEEIKELSSRFTCVESRMQIPQNSLVIGRYSCLPFYHELDRDLGFLNSRLINSLREHQYVANLGEYVQDLGDLTFKTWSSLDQVPKSEAPFVLKGATNSLKNQWETKMFARTWEDAVQVYIRLSEDSLIGTQDIYIRKYEKLFELGKTVTGLPITKEFRFFVYKGQILSGGFYWDAFAEDLPFVPSVDEVPSDWLANAISEVADFVPYFVMDVAQTATGTWKVVELNDGQMSGLSGNSPGVLYSSLLDCLRSDNLG
jgi:hypothetical protein